jgi:CRISPR-associated protein Cas1
MSKSAAGTGGPFGRLGIASAEIAQADRHGLIWLSRGKLYVEDGTLKFDCAESADLEAGLYSIPYQQLSLICLGPGTSVTHDALRITASHGTGIVAVGDGGVKFYSAPPMGKTRSKVARNHARLWSDETTRLDVARKMYAIRFGRILPHKNISVLRGIEGGRVKETYKMLALKHGVVWEGRRYDRNNPEGADIPNQAINHASTFVEAAAEIAVACAGGIPSLGFIHEDSSNAFTLDIADLFRATITIPLAFSVAAKYLKQPGAYTLEREVRYAAAATFRKTKLISTMIDHCNDILKVEQIKTETIGAEDEDNL